MLNTLATLYRAAQFYAHNAHNLTKGSTFFADHDFFGELYLAYESAYDALVERMIGLNKKPDLHAITLEAAIASKTNDATAEQFCNRLLSHEKAICKEITKINADLTLGTQNLVQGLADESEARQYKLAQRAAL